MPIPNAITEETHREIAADVRRTLQGRPELHYQGWWITLPDEDSPAIRHPIDLLSKDALLRQNELGPGGWACGTTACFAGHVLLSAVGAGYTEFVGYKDRWEDIVTKFLGIGMNQAYEMMHYGANANFIIDILSLIEDGVYEEDERGYWIGEQS